MSVNTARGQIYSELKDLRVLWRHSREQWDDAVARAFEEQFWQPLEAAAVGTISALDRLEQVLLQVRRECGGSETFFDE